MHKKAPILFCLFLLALIAPALPQEKEPPKEPPKEINVTGVWDLTTQTPNGDMPSEATLTQEKEVVKLSVLGSQGTPLNGEGTVKGGVIQWSLTFGGPNGDFTIFFKGKVDGDKMSGEVQAGDYGTFTWFATKRKK